MHLRLDGESRVSVTVRSKGLLGALEHELEFRAQPEAVALPDIDPGAPMDLPIEARVPVTALAAPVTASPFDRRQMIENLRGKDVLDADRWPTLAFRGRYRGTLERGRLEGELTVRGVGRAIGFDVAITDEADGRRARARWEGTLNGDLGIKPFKALLGALRLHDFARIDLDLLFSTSA